MGPILVRIRGDFLFLKSLHYFIQTLRAFRRAASFGLFGCWFVGFVFVCWFVGVRFFVVFVRGSSCLGLLVYLLARPGAFLGSIFGLWGCLGLCFEGSGVPWVALGVLGGRFGRPGGPKSNFLTFSPLILRSFWLHFGAQNRCKIWCHFWLVFRLIFEAFLADFRSHVGEILIFFLDIFSGMAKTRKIARRLHESIKIECSGGRKWHQHLKKWLRKPVQKRMRNMLPKLTEF